MHDLLAVTRAAQALMEERDLADLRHAVVRLLREVAGAQYAALVDFSEGEGWVIHCQSEGECRSPADLPARVLHTVRSTLQPLHLADAITQSPHCDDEVVRARGLRSVLCHPLRSRGRWHGLLYFESTLGPGAFDAVRLSLLEVLVAQAVLALDNAWLHQHLSEDISDRKRAEHALQQLNEEIEQRVAERTKQLHTAQQELLDRARHAGMVEIASSILHNLGNALTGISVSSALLREHIKQLPIASLGRLVALFERPPEALGTFLTQDKRGRHLPEFLSQLHSLFTEKHHFLLEECAAMAMKVEHANQVIATQQNYARTRITLCERLRLRELAEDALRLCALGESVDSLVQREYGEEEPGMYERHMIVQILVNLITNARSAVRERPGSFQPRITLSIHQDVNRTVTTVSDNGVGFDESIRARLFTYGFTTREKGHGFGLHSAALNARSLGGHIEAHSDGPGQGARFVFVLPRPQSEGKAGPRVDSGS